MTLEAPGGLVEVVARCRDGKAQSITVTNVPSFAARLDASLEVEGLGSLRVDTAYGGDSFVMVDAADLGFEIVPDEAADLARLGARITRAANEQLGFEHPTNPDWRHISFCQIAGPLIEQGGRRVMRNTVVIDPGKLDRSPTGTGLSARMAVLRARGAMDVGDELEMRSVIDSMFLGRVVADTTVGGRAAIVPSITGPRGSRGLMSTRSIRTTRGRAGTAWRTPGRRCRERDRDSGKGEPPPLPGGWACVARGAERESLNPSPPRLPRTCTDLPPACPGRRGHSGTRGRWRAG